MARRRRHCRILRIRGRDGRLTRRFGDFTAVDRVTLRIPKGHLYGFLGLNGAGKTTTIRMLTTLLPPSSGTAKLWGHDVAADPLAVRRLIGLVSDETSESQSGWTAREYLALLRAHPPHRLSRATTSNNCSMTSASTRPSAASSSAPTAPA